jgi:hypothetical protein
MAGNAERGARRRRRVPQRAHPQGQTDRCAAPYPSPPPWQHPYGRTHLAHEQAPK